MGADGRRLLQGNAFALEQATLPIQSAGEAAQFSIRRDHAMTRNQNRNRVRAACAAHGADRLRFAHGAGNFTVAFGLATGDFSQRVPNLLLKRCAVRQIHRWKFSGRTSGENTFQRGSGCAVPAENFGL